MNKQFSALVLGATGLVGQQLLVQLQQDKRYHKITCLVRREMAVPVTPGDKNKVETVIDDYENLADYKALFTAEHIYVCLGTTLKSAGSKEAFRRVDFDYVYTAAQLAATQQAKSFVWISTVGANSRSGRFYLKVKGQLEDAIFAISELNHAAVVRPSLLLGQRNELRPGEQLGIVLGRLLAPLMLGPLHKYRPIKAANVARQMIKLQVFV